MKYFSNKKRPFHLDPFPLERLVRFYARPELSAVPSMPVSDFSQHGPESLAHSMAIFIAMMDVVRGGKIVNGLAEIPIDEQEHSRHFKAAGYYFDGGNHKTHAVYGWRDWANATDGHGTSVVHPWKGVSIPL